MMRRGARTAGVDRDVLVELLRRADLVDLVGRDVTLKKRGREWIGLSPFNAEKTPSFTVAPHKGFWHCFSSGRHGDAVGWLMQYHGLRFADAVRELSSLTGFPLEQLGFGPSRPSQSANRGVRREIGRCADRARLRADREAQRDRFIMAQAAKIWREASLAEGTAATAYLGSRGISLAAPPSLRFAELRHLSTGNETWPCMVAVMQDSAGGFAGVHRTFLDRERPDKAPIEPNRMMLGRARGAVIRLCPAAPHLYLAEGIETALSVMQACQVPCWAVMSRGNFQHFAPPEGCIQVTNLADNDTKDWRAARREMRRAALAQSERGLIVETAWPPRKTDFNDLLMGRLS